MHLDIEFNVLGQMSAYVNVQNKVKIKNISIIPKISFCPFWVILPYPHPQ